MSNGTGGLTLTITDAHSNVLAQTTTYIQIVDIKQMYERWTVGDNPNVCAHEHGAICHRRFAGGRLAVPYTLIPERQHALHSFRSWLEYGVVGKRPLRGIRL